METVWGGRNQLKQKFGAGAATVERAAAGCHILLSVMMLQSLLSQWYEEVCKPPHVLKTFNPPRQLAEEWEDASPQARVMLSTSCLRSLTSPSFYPLGDIWGTHSEESRCHQVNPNVKY